MGRICSKFYVAAVCFQCRRIPVAYDLTANSRVHYYPSLSSTSSTQSEMYLIILLSVTLWRLFGGCYLFAVETPLGSVQPIRHCCSVNSPMTSSGWAWLLFKWVSFVFGGPLSSNLPVTDSQGGCFNGITVHSTPCGVVTQGLTEVPMLSETENKMAETPQERRMIT